MRPVKNVLDGARTVFSMIRRELEDSTSDTITITVETPEEYILLSAESVDLETYIDKGIGEWRRSGQVSITCDRPITIIDKDADT